MTAPPRVVHTTAPPEVLRVLRHGGTAALACAAASSVVSLYSLAILVGWPSPLAWLLPASLDVYAGVSLYVGSRLDDHHAATITARRNARFALALSVACNAVYHALVLFGAACPAWAHDALLIIVSALPPVVVERVLHLRSKISNHDGGTNATPTTVTPTERRPVTTNERTPPAAVPNTVTPPENVTPTQPPERSVHPERPTVTIPNVRQSQPANGGTNVTVGVDTWVQIARPIYQQIRDGKRDGGTNVTQCRPTVPELHTALNTRIDELAAKGDLPDTARGMSESNVKKIRLELENRFPDLTPLIHAVVAA